MMSGEQAYIAQGSIQPADYDNLMGSRHHQRHVAYP